MKRTLTLGLMVFFLGLFMTACGSKKSSSPATTATNTNGTGTDTNNPFPNSITQLTNSNGSGSCATNCQQSYSKNLYIQNQDAYAQMVGLSNYNTNTNTNNYSNNYSNNTNYGNNFFGSLFNALGGSLINAGANAVTCLTQAGVAKLISNWTDGPVDGGCSSSNTTISGGQNIASSYPINYTAHGQNNQFIGWTGNINNGLGGSNGYTFDLVKDGDWLVDRYTNNSRPRIGVQAVSSGVFQLYVYQNNSRILVGEIR